MINLELRTTLNDAFIITDLHWAKKGDLTVMLIQDWGVLKLYHTFLKDWIKVFRNATTDNICDHKKMPLTFTPNMPKKWLKGKGMRKHKPTRKSGRNNSLRQNLRKGSQRNRLMKKQKGPTLQT